MSPTNPKSDCLELTPHAPPTSDPEGAPSPTQDAAAGPSASEDATAEEPELLTPEEACGVLRVPLGTFTQWLSTGRVQVPHIRLAPRTVRVPRRELLEWLAEQRAASKAALRAHVARGRTGDEPTGGDQ